MQTAIPTVEVDAELSDLMPQYLSNRWSDLGFARRLLAEQEFLLLCGMAHRIKGNAASYGFSELGAIAASIEAAAQNQDSAAVDRALEAYDAYLRAVKIEYV